MMKHKKLKNNGYEIYKQFFNLKDIANIKKVLNKKIIEAEKKDINIIYDLHNVDKFFIDLISNDRLTKLLIPILNDKYYKSINKNKPNYILSEYIAARSSKDGLHLHIDSWVPSSSNFCNMVQIVIPLGKRDNTNGCSILVPGSHKSDKYANRNINKSKIKNIEIDSGDMVIWDSRTWHGTSQFTQNKSPWSLIITMQAWFLKQRFDFPRDINKNILKKLTNKQKTLLGFYSMPPKNSKKNIMIRQGY